MCENCLHPPARGAVSSASPVTYILCASARYQLCHMDLDFYFLAESMNPALSKSDYFSPAPASQPASQECGPEEECAPRRATSHQPPATSRQHHQRTALTNLGCLQERNSESCTRLPTCVELTAHQLKSFQVSPCPCCNVP